MKPYSAHVVVHGVADYIEADNFDELVAKAKSRVHLGLSEICLMTVIIAGLTWGILAQVGGPWSLPAVFLCLFCWLCWRPAVGHTANTILLVLAWRREHDKIRTRHME